MKIILLLLTFCLTNSLWAQDIAETKIKKMTSKRLIKDFNQDHSILSSNEDYYYIKKLRTVNSSKKMLGTRAYKVYLYTRFSCYKSSNIKEELFGECSVILRKRFRKTALWTSNIDQESKCFCGDKNLTD